MAVMLGPKIMARNGFLPMLFRSERLEVAPWRKGTMTIRYVLDCEWSGTDVFT